MIPTFGLVYVDSNAVIYTVEAFEPYLSILLPFWEAAQPGQAKAITSEITLAEVLVQPLRRGESTLITEYRNLVMHSSALRAIPIDAAVLEKAAELRALTPSLRTPDAIHLATAILNGCDHFLTNDRRLRNLPHVPVIFLDDLLPTSP